MAETEDGSPLHEIGREAKKLPVWVWVAGGGGVLLLVVLASRKKAPAPGTGASDYTLSGIPYAPPVVGTLPTDPTSLGTTTPTTPTPTGAGTVPTAPSSGVPSSSVPRDTFSLGGMTLPGSAPYGVPGTTPAVLSTLPAGNPITNVPILPPLAGTIGAPVASTTDWLSQGTPVEQINPGWATNVVPGVAPWTGSVLLPSGFTPEMTQSVLNAHGGSVGYVNIPQPSGQGFTAGWVWQPGAPPPPGHGGGWSPAHAINSANTASKGPLQMGGGYGDPMAWTDWHAQGHALAAGGGHGSAQHLNWINTGNTMIRSLGGGAPLHPRQPIGLAMSTAAHVRAEFSRVASGW